MFSGTGSRLRDAIGLSVVFFALASCGGGGGGGGSSAPPGSKIFFVDGGNRAIVSSINATPTTALSIDRVVEGTHTLLGPVPGDILSIPSVTLDAANDRLYVATQGNTLVYNNISTADGDVAPNVIMSATINTDIRGNRGVNFMHNDVNRSNGTLYSVDFAGEVHVFNSPITSPSTVSRLINPDLGATTILATFGLALDTTQNMLYMGAVFSGTGSSNIIVFNNASTIGTAPTTITPVAPDRTLSFAQAVVSFYLDTAGDRLYVAHSDGIVRVFDGAHSIPTGTPTPNRTIDLGGGTPIDTYIFVETGRNKLYAVASNTANQVGVLGIIDNASTANGPGTGNFFSVSPVPNIALSAVAVAP
jgi:hypothetical protein